MKKIRNFICVLLIALCCTVFAGTVSAAGSAEQFQVVCLPTTVKGGQPVDCYLLAKITGDGVFAVETKLHNPNAAEPQETTNLTIQNVGVTTVKKATVKAVHLNNGKSNTDLTTLAPNYTCTNVDNDTGCYVFYAATATGRITAETDNAVPQLGSQYTGFTVIGYYTAKTKEVSGSDCGRLCVDVRIAQTPEGMQNGPDFTSPGKSLCPEFKIDPGSGTTTIVETGSFVSYAVLVAGALVAISAIVATKKHNKFYRV